MYRAIPIEISEADPFKNDALDRRPVVEFLAALLGRINGPFVLALDAPWGAGKTTLIRMLQAALRNDGYACVDFNAWETDYAADPLVALLASLKQLPGAKGKATVKKLTGIATAVARRSVVAGAKIATMGVLDVEKEAEKIIADAAGGVAGDLVESFENQKSLLNQFKAGLRDAIAAIAVNEKKPNIIFFIDEIDRCRPSFAVELLERIKHLFDAKNVIFVLSLDKPQLEAGICSVYGSSFDAAEYLRRFIDLDFSIPLPSRTRLTRALFERFEFGPFFSARTHSELRYDAGHLLRYLSGLADALNLTPRTMERCFARIRVVLDQTPTDHYLYPLLVSVFVVLRSTNESLYRDIVTAQKDYRDLAEYLSRTIAGRAFVSGRDCQILFAEMIGASGEEAKGVAIARLSEEVEERAEDNKPTRKAEQAAQILEFLHHSGRRFRDAPSMRLIIGKIDLAARIDQG
jgi:hypothetical protein